MIRAAKSWDLNRGRLLLVAVAAEAVAFLIQWLLQQMNVGGVFRDVMMILISALLLGWLAWRLAPLSSGWLSSSVVAFMGVWLWGYLALPIMRVVLERAVGQLSAEMFQAALRGALSAFVLFSPLALALAVLASYLSRRRFLRKENNNQPAT